MADKEVLFTQEGFNEANARLDYLKTAKRHEIAEKIKVARDFGDLSENAEYEEAKTEQAFIEGEILELEYKVKNAVIINKMSTDVVTAGSRVKVLDTEDKEVSEYLIVGRDEADLDQGRISNESPMGKALIGAKVGDVVFVNAPTLTYSVEVIELN
ncbi:MAG: transcription elongation factor GreA [Eubacteriaceae bacterium]|jgi:transcription elongation factor GreA|nr:transcription elongation factor GreA [Eubacteriaceae bacterium]